MSTRAIYTILGDQEPPINIYIHSDGYPTGAANHIRNAFPHAWEFPRFEPDEFAAALVAGNKSYFLNEELALLRELVGMDGPDASNGLSAIREKLKRIRSYGHGGGGVRIFPSVDPTPENLARLAVDIEYRYELRWLDSALWVKCFQTSYWGGDTPLSEEELFSGTFTAFHKWAVRREKAEKAAYEREKKRRKVAA